MIIDGTKVERGQNFKELNGHYFQAIQSIVAEALFELEFVQIVSYSRPKTMDSVYFRFKMKHHGCLFTLSLRNHLPNEYRNAYFYIYLYNYDHLEELKIEIQKQLSDHYNKLAILKQPSNYARSQCNYSPTKKKQNQSQYKGCNVCFNESLCRLMNEINNKT